jgi:hypothetical protein
MAATMLGEGRRHRLNTEANLGDLAGSEAWAASRAGSGEARSARYPL